MLLLPLSFLLSPTSIFLQRLEFLCNQAALTPTIADSRFHRIPNSKRLHIVAKTGEVTSLFGKERKILLSRGGAYASGLQSNPSKRRTWIGCSRVESRLSSTDFRLEWSLSQNPSWQPDVLKLSPVLGIGNYFVCTSTDYDAQ